MEKLLQIERLRVEYHSDGTVVHAVNDLSLSLDRKQTLGLVGETGAGKTTTALSIMRLLPANTGRVVQGTISFDGRDLQSLSDGEMRAIRGDRIAMVFQDPMSSLNPVIPVGKQIAEAILLHNHEGWDRQRVEQRVDEMLELVGIPATRKTDYPHQFSGGMKQRVVIAIALACNPELLIADEPTTALDVTIQAQVLDMMMTLKQKLGTSVLLISHDLGVVAKVCDDVAVMYAGSVVETGRVEDIFSDVPHHPYTEGLFRSIPSLDDESRRLSPIEGLMPDPTDLPNGCKFHPRCPRCMDLCRTQEPETVAVTDTHRVKCLLFSQPSEGREEKG